RSLQMDLFARLAFAMLSQVFHDGEQAGIVLRAENDGIKLSVAELVDLDLAQERADLCFDWPLIKGLHQSVARIVKSESRLRIHEEGELPRGCWKVECSPRIRAGCPS